MDGLEDQNKPVREIQIIQIPYVGYNEQDKQQQKNQNRNRGLDTWNR